MKATTKKTAGAREVSVGSTGDDSTLTIRIRGNEMWPKVGAGDLVEVEPACRIEGGGGTYVVELDGHQLLQHVQRKPGRRLRLFSENDAHEDTIIRQSAESEWVTAEGYTVEFEVLGRYVGVADSSTDQAQW